MGERGRVVLMRVWARSAKEVVVCDCGSFEEFMVGRLQPFTERKRISLLPM